MRRGLGWSFVSCILVATAPAARADRPAGYLQLDGVDIGWVDEADVPIASSADVIVMPPPPAAAAAGAMPTKRLGSRRYEPIELRTGPTLSSALYDWVGAAWAGKRRRASGVLLQLVDGSPIQHQFFDASVTETIFPALDARSHDPASLRVMVTPLALRSSSVTGALPAPAAPGRVPWDVSGFRVSVAGIDTGGVVGVGEIAVKTPVAVDPSPRMPLPPPPSELSDVVLYVDPSRAETFLRWARSFITDGHDGVEDEKSGTIEYLSPDGKTTYFRLDLKNLGVFRITAVERPKRVLKVEMYCESIVLRALAATPPPAPVH